MELPRKLLCVCAHTRVCMCVCARAHAHAQWLSHVQLFVTPWPGARQAPLSMEFSRQEYCHFLLHGIFPAQGLNLGLLHCRWSLCCLHHQGSPGNKLQTTASLQDGSLGPSGAEVWSGLEAGDWLHKKQLDSKHYFLIPTLEHKETASWGV